MNKFRLLPLVLALLLLLSACGKPKETEITYTHTFQALDYFAGALEFEELSSQESDPDIQLKEIFIDPETLSHGYITVEIQSQQALTFQMHSNSKHSDGTALGGDNAEVTLTPGEVLITELVFNGWPDGSYSVTMTTEGLPTEQAMLIQLP